MFCPPSPIRVPWRASTIAGRQTKGGQTTISAWCTFLTKGRNAAANSRAPSGVLYIFQLAAMSFRRMQVRPGDPLPQRRGVLKHLARFCRDMNLRLRWPLAAMRLHDKLRVALTGEERPHGLRPDPDPVPRRRKIQNVDESPRQPSQQPAHFRESRIHNGKSTPDYRHVAFVKITKRLRRWSPGLFIPDHFADIRAPLHRHLRDTRERLPVLIKRGSIADDEDLWMSWYTAVRRNPDAPGPVGRRVQPFAGRRRGDSGCPDRRAARNGFITDYHVCLVNRLDGLAESHLHAHAFQARLGFARKLFGKICKDPRACFCQDYTRPLRVDPAEVRLQCEAAQFG